MEADRSAATTGPPDYEEVPSDTLFYDPAKWWLSDGNGNAFGPFTRRGIETRLRRYRIYRRHSQASRRSCWAKAGDNPFVGKGGES